MENRYFHFFSIIHTRVTQVREYWIKLLSLSIFCLLLSVSWVEGKVYEISVVAEGGLFDVGQRFLKEAYQRIGMDVEFKQMPAERALKSSNLGVIDGEIFRVDNINMLYTNLIKVPTSYIFAENVVFSKTLNIHVDGYDSLRPYRIGFRRGLKIVELNMVGFPKLHPVPETKQAFLMLGLGRLDAVIEEKMTGLSYVKRLQLDGIKTLEGAVSREPLFHYLHNKNRDLIPKLDAVFQKMNQERVLEKIMTNYTLGN